MSQGFGRHEGGRIAKEGKAESPCKAGVAEMACQGPLWNVPETFRMPRVSRSLLVRYPVTGESGCKTSSTSHLRIIILKCLKEMLLLLMRHL